MFNLSNLLESSTREYAHRTAFSFADTKLSYAQLNGAANQIANALVASGIKKGDKIALSCLNIPYFPMVYFAILKAGATVVPLSVLLKEDEVAYHLKDSQAKAYFCFTGTEALPMGERGFKGFENVETCTNFYMIMPQPSMASSIKNTTTLGEFMAGQSANFDSAMTSSDDTAIIIYTSGTTGKPKGAELTHSNIFMNTLISKDLLMMTHEDISLVSLPLFHIFSMTVLMMNIVYTGSEGVLVPRFDPKDVIDIMVKHQVTIFAGVPTMYWALSNYDANASDIKHISNNMKIAVSGGASLPVNVINAFEKKFNVAIYEGYGMSEGSPIVTFNQRSTGRKPGSIGTPVWGVQVKLVDDEGNEVKQGEKGELLYKGHNVMKGYFNKPDINKETIKDGWLYSGDIATQDEDGFYYIVDRTKDMIIRGGFNVYPREVEEVMINHEAVSLVAVIGVPNEARGEEIKACVVLKEGRTVSEDDLMAWTKSKMADYKYPRIITFMKALPMSATGKILKKELRKMN